MAIQINSALRFDSKDVSLRSSFTQTNFPKACFFSMLPFSCCCCCWFFWTLIIYFNDSRENENSFAHFKIHRSFTDVKIWLIFVSQECRFSCHIFKWLARKYAVHRSRRAFVWAVYLMDKDVTESKCKRRNLHIPKWKHWSEYVWAWAWHKGKIAMPNGIFLFINVSVNTLNIIKSDIN